MDINIKTRVNDLIQEYLVERKAMFIPIACVSAFMLVGYAAVDKEKPEIISNQIELPYGEKLDLNTIDVKDNRDNREMIALDVVDSTLDEKQLGSYKVKVRATDQFSNETTKTVTVNVVDQAGPTFEMLGANEGYVVQVPVNGSNDFASYVKAVDNVDGEVTPFIEADKTLDTSKPGFQTIALKVTDSSGNTTKETYEFAISDMEAPKIELVNGENPEVDYGSEFKLESIATISDNFDPNFEVTTEGNIDTKQEGVQTIKLTAKDVTGNVSEQSIDVNVKDISAPQITLSKSSITVDAGAAVDGREYLASAIDNKDGDVTNKVGISKVNTGSAGNKTITFTISDAAGNSSEASLAVKVEQPIGGNGNYSGNSALGYAISRIGSAYRLGATGPNVFDCSGLMYWSFQQVGKSIPRTSSGQAAGGTYVSRSDLQPGDLVFFSASAGGRISHVGMYVGGGRMVHAGTPSSGVCYSSINIMHYVTARRY